MTLLLKNGEILPLLDMPKAIEAIEAAFRQQGNRQVSEHAPFVVRAGGGKGGMRVITGALQNSGHMVVSLGGGTGPTIGAPPPEARRGGIVCLTDLAGNPLAVMSQAFGTLRTGAVVAVAAKYLAKTDSKRVGLFGPARNAYDVLRGVACVRSIESFHVFGRNPENREAFAKRATELVGLPVEPVGSAREAVEGMDIVLTQTASLEPVFDPEWLEAGQFISASGIGRVSEIHPQVFLRANQVVVSSKEHDRNYFDPGPPMPILDLIAEGKMSWEGIDELGDIVVGSASGRQATEDIIVFHESQGGITNVALAEAIYEEAVKRGLGTHFDFRT
jgi:ornithine cyclodeaminase/alanine dehydrogenase-like protein (mu-crystallin family)